MLYLVSTLALVLIALGLYYRKNRKWHVRYMVSAFVVDLMLVLYIEITRHAVEQVTTAKGFLLPFHIWVSTLCLVAYIVQLVLGTSLLKGKKHLRTAHIITGISFVVLRLTNYVTSYMI